MKKIAFVIIVGISQPYMSSAQGSSISLVPGISVTYDNNGNRILRKPDWVCLGCKTALPDSLKETPIEGSIQNNEAILVEAFPNPTQKDLYINNRVWKEGDVALVKIFDMLGKKVFEKNFSQAKDLIYFEKYAPATYTAHYYYNNKLAHVWKIVKM